jgi:hypothetical protein
MAQRQQKRVYDTHELEDVELFCAVGGVVDAGTNVVTVWTTPPEVVVTTWGVDVDDGIGGVVDVLVEDDCEDEVELEDDVDEEEEDDRDVKVVEVVCVESEEVDEDDDLARARDEFGPRRTCKRSTYEVGVVWVGTTAVTYIRRTSFKRENDGSTYGMSEEGASTW